jgi:general secretion pathway protein J
VRRRPGSRTSAGFTLLELLVAVSLLSVLAVLSWRGMESVLSGRDAIVERSDELRALTIAMAQIEEDLRRAWPVRLLGLATPPVGFAAGDDQAPPSLELLRETAGGDSSEVQRVIWRLRDGVLERGFSAWTAPMPGEASTSDVLPFTWQPVIGAVQGLEFRGWLSGRGWLPAATLAQNAAANQSQAAMPPLPDGGVPLPPMPVTSAPLITGVELLLVRRGERILRVFAVGD